MRKVLLMAAIFLGTTVMANAAVTPKTNAVKELRAKHPKHRKARKAKMASAEAAKPDATKAK